MPQGGIPLHMHTQAQSARTPHMHTQPYPHTHTHPFPLQPAAAVPQAGMTPEQEAHARGQALAELVAREAALNKSESMGSRASTTSTQPHQELRWPPQLQPGEQPARQARQSSGSSDCPAERRRAQFGFGSIRCRRSSTGSSYLDSEHQPGTCVRTQVAMPANGHAYKCTRTHAHTHMVV